MCTERSWIVWKVHTSGQIMICLNREIKEDSSNPLIQKHKICVFQSQRDQWALFALPVSLGVQRSKKQTRKRGPCNQDRQPDQDTEKLCQD